MDAPQEPLKGLPFSTDQLLKAVDESSRRSRSILLLLTFTSFLVLMALINSLLPKFNWFKSKIEIKKDIVNYIILPVEFLDSTNYIHHLGKTRPISKLSAYIIQNETQYYDGEVNLARRYLRDSIDKVYPIVGNFHLQNPALAPVIAKKWRDRWLKYLEIGSAMNYMNSHNIYDRSSILNSLSKFEDAQIEHMELIKVPILGISFHTNYLGLYSGLLLTILLVIFYFSLLREKINLKITFKRAWTDISFKHHHYYLYEYAAMLQVLSIPKKLFKEDAEQKGYNKIYLVFSAVAKYFPLLVYAFVVFYDFFTVYLGYEDNELMTLLTIAFNLVFLSLICIMTRKVAREWEKLDTLWKNQAYEFNIEFIFEAIGIEKKQVLTQLYPAKISPSDEQSVKLLWYHALNGKWSENIKHRERNAEKMLSNFINLALGRHLSDRTGKVDQKQIEESWSAFHDWFNKTGRKNVSSRFSSSFADMVEKIRDSKAM